MASKTTVAIYSSLIRRCKSKIKWVLFCLAVPKMLTNVILESKNTQLVFVLCTHSVSCWKTLLLCYYKRMREQLSVYLALSVVLGQTECFWKGERKSYTVKEAVIQLLLRCNEEEEGESKSEGAVLLEFGRWRGMGLPPAEVRPQQLCLCCCVHGSGPGHLAQLSWAWSSLLYRASRSKDKLNGEQYKELVWCSGWLVLPFVLW